MSLLSLINSFITKWQHDHGSHGRNRRCLSRSGHPVDTDRAYRAEI